MSVWDRRKEILYGNGLVGEVIQTTPLPGARSLSQSAMTVECERFIYYILMCTTRVKAEHACCYSHNIVRHCGISCRLQILPIRFRHTAWRTTSHAV